MTEERFQTGLLLKRGPRVGHVRWQSASLREAGIDSEGYYLKVDGCNEEGETDQLYLMLSEVDVTLVIAQWKKIVEEQGSPFARYHLRSALKEAG